MPVKWYGKKIMDEALQQMEKNLEHVGVVLSGEMRASINRSPASGRVYKRRGIVHRASAPGEPPATDRGTLSASIDYKVERTGRYKRLVRVGTQLKYGKWLEYGTVRIKPRPFARPALKKYEKKLPEMVFKDCF
jgi:HK97 gp10 family phage protein